jgi:hypothetical protein
MIFQKGRRGENEKVGEGEREKVKGEREKGER